MKVGETKKVVITQSSTTDVSNEVEANTIYSTSQGEIKIFNVTAKIMFMGHKLAGETLYFNITLKNISSAASKKDCISKYNLSSETVFFYHADWCPHCKKMIPWVQGLQDKGYKFLFAEVSNASAMNILKDCMSDVLQLGGGVPQFGCSSNGQMHIGEFRSTDDMKKFADDCRAAAKLQDSKKSNTTNIAAPGLTVTVAYTGKLKTGEIFDNGTITFKVGDGNMIPGFDEAVNGMKINENKYVEIQPDKAYGYPVPQPRIQTVPTEQLKTIIGEYPVLNKEYSVSGLPWKIKIIKITASTKNITVTVLNITGGFNMFFNGTGIIPICANNVSLDKKKFYECYSSGVKKAVVDADVKYASSLGVGGTPTFFTGCDAATIEKICANLSPAATSSCKGRLATNSKLNCTEDGKYLVYEFTDFQCPYCFQAESLVNELKNNPTVKLNIKSFPVHKGVDKEAYAAECARDQGKFEEFKECAFKKYFVEGVRVIE